MMELFWTPEATQDRDEIYNHIEADNPAAALALDELLAEKAGRLVDQPGLGRLGRVAGTCELVFKDLPMHGKRMGIYIDTKRMRCQSCGKTFSQALPVLAENRITSRNIFRLSP